MEAFASGTSVITTNMEGPKDIITEGIDGFLIEPLNAKKISDKMVFLLQNRGKALEMGLKGKEKVIKTYSWNKTVDKIEAFLLNVISDCRI